MSARKSLDREGHIICQKVYGICQKSMKREEELEKVSENDTKYFRLRRSKLCGKQFSKSFVSKV